MIDYNEGLQEKLRCLERTGSKIHQKDGGVAETLKQELESLRAELKLKERELDNKARLLSERERQLGQLREQLDLAKRLSDRRHGPDAGGGLPADRDEGSPEEESYRMTASRAEDIPCLRQSSFVMRRQSLNRSETQEELVEKLVKMAAMQISSQVAEQRANDSQEQAVAVEKTKGWVEARTPRRGCPPGRTRTSS